MLEFHFDEELSVPDNYEVFVSDYHRGWYDGYGEAIGIKDGHAYIYNLSHCSCYGPTDDGPEEEIPLDRYMNNAMISLSDNVYRKSIELLNQRQQMQVKFDREYTTQQFAYGKFYENDSGIIMLYQKGYQLYFHNDDVVLADKGSMLYHKWRPYTGKMEINCGEKDEDS